MDLIKKEKPFVDFEQKNQTENLPSLEPPSANRGVTDTQMQLERVIAFQRAALSDSCVKCSGLSIDELSALLDYMDNNGYNKNIADDCIIVDWLTFAIKDGHFDFAVCLLGLSDKEWIKGKASRLHYEQVKTYGNIAIHFTSENASAEKKYNTGCCVEMSGQGCRTFETYSEYGFVRLFQYLYVECSRVGLIRNVTISRLDLAFDDHTGLFDLPLIIKYARNLWFTSTFKSFEIIESFKEIDLDKRGLSVVFGSRSSAVMLRIYDKRVERNAFDLEHWVRCELQLRSDAASGFVSKYCSAIGERFALGSLFSGILSKYLQFREPSKTDSNKSRWEIAEFWQNILGECMQISCFDRKDVEYNLDRMERYALKQNHNHTRSLCEMIGVGEYLLSLHQYPDKIPDKYKTVAAALENGDQLLKRINELPVEHDLDYLRRAQTDIQDTINRIVAEHEALQD